MGCIALDCPHCLKENVAFQSVGEHSSRRKRFAGKNVFTAFFVCGNCDAGIMAEIEAKTKHSPHQFESGLQGLDQFIVHDIYPKKMPVSAPDHLPGNINNFYLQAANNLKPKFWDSAAMIGGKVLEASFKIAFPEIEGTLYHRIEKLADNHIITESMKQWAHEVRLIRNEASHSVEEVLEDDARDLMAFVEVFLMYTFTLPGMLETRRKKTDR